jgi:TonB family protein
VYTDAARSWRVQGVVGLNIVVDSTGAVRKVSIVRPLGVGLDENAVATVSTWRFTPAKADGRPVATAIRIDVAFHLF